MKIHFLSISFLSVAGAFSTTNTCSSLSGRTTFESNTLLFAENKKPLSPKEILDQQRAKHDVTDPDKHPKLFSDELLDDMKEILLLLEKRIQEGPGSIDAAEVEKFAGMSKNVQDEMKQKEYERLEDAKSPSAGSSPAAVGTTTTVVNETPTTAASAGVDTTEKPSPAVQSSMEEGPAYSPDGGQGSTPRGTRNTYVIPGMDEMSPEEYQKALQDSIIQRQDKRKTSGAYGNRNTWDYLNNLSGDSGVLKKVEDKSEN